MGIICFVGLVAIVFEIVYSPRVDYSHSTGLLLWYNGIDSRGNKLRVFKKLI